VAPDPKVVLPSSTQPPTIGRFCDVKELASEK